MGHICLAAEWKYKLGQKGWSSSSCDQFVTLWAPSMLECYNRALDKLEEFCIKKDYHDFPNIPQEMVTDYMCMVASTRDRPRSALNTLVSALTGLVEATGQKNLLLPEIYKLLIALTKGSTSQPMNISKVMPISAFMELFKRWPGNHYLLSDLCLKCVTLLALAAMLRPSDAAQKGKVFNQQSGRFDNLILSTHNIFFMDDGSTVLP